MYKPVGYKMLRVSRSLIIICLSGLLAACQTQGPGGLGAGAGPGVTPNAVTGGEIEVTALEEGPGAGPDALTDEVPTEAPETAATQGAEPVPEPGTDATDDPGTPGPKPAPADEEAPDEVVEALPETAEDLVPEAVEVPAEAKSALQLACEKKRGIWSRAGAGDSMFCVFKTRDSGKSCKRESDCDGLCLARSGTCSPIKPLFGCHEILQENGARVTQCIE